MAELKKKRGIIRSAVTRIIKYLDNENRDNSQLPIRQQKLDELWAEFDKIQTQIEIAVEDENDLLQEELIRVEVEENFYSAKSRFNALLQTCSDASNNVSSTPTIPTIGSPDGLEATLRNLAANQSSLSGVIEHMLSRQNPDSTNTLVTADIKLPRLNLPIYSGDYNEWPSFKALFDSTVHSNQSLTNSQKLQYLKTSLKGEAAAMLRHLSITNDNYEEAYNELIARYDKPQCIIDSYIKIIMEQPQLTVSSFTALKKLFSEVNEAVRGLKAMKQPVDSWDSLLIYIISGKLDSESRQLWIRERPTDENPDFKTFRNFLEKRIFELEMVQHSKNTSMIKTKYPKVVNRNVCSAEIISCIKCKKSHYLYKCHEFKQLNAQQRKEFVLKHSLCINCFKNGHKAADCKSSCCLVCSKKHNTLLHENYIEISKPSRDDTDVVNTMTSQLSLKAIILPTAIVEVQNYAGEFQLCRALLDTGSQITMISERYVQRLGLKREYSKIKVSGVGSGKSLRSRGSVPLRLKSRFNNRIFEITALILNKLTKDQLHQMVDKDTVVGEFSELLLADPYFYQANKIDMIIGADIFFKALEIGKVVDSTGQFIALNTTFGWVITGTNHSSSTEKEVLLSVIDTDQLLKKFWELENINENIPLNEEEVKCEEHYCKTVLRSDNQGYVVRLPFRDNKFELGDSRTTALKSLFALEKRLERNQFLKQEYHEFIKEYLNLGHMRAVPINEYGKGKFYLPHHAVVKDSSLTTRLRVVFDASRKSSSGLSLNNVLMVGSISQNDSFAILLRFRKSKVAFVGDIMKMYRQIQMNDEDCAYQRILWRFSNEETVSEYELNTVTYGTSPAPFLATRTLKQLTIDEGCSLPEAVKLVNHSFYIDDLVHSSDDVKDAINARNELITLIEKGNFKLRKWSSNSKEFIQDLKQNYNSSDKNFITHDPVVKVLGIQWNTEHDQFYYELNIPDSEKAMSKRELLSKIARIFDPLGLLAPVIVKLKILMQHLWINTVSWDENVPDRVLQQYNLINSELNLLNNLRIDRWLKFRRSGVVQLHAFADASEAAYAGVIYMRTIDCVGNISVQLVTSKTRVAPIQQISLPRLELCAALLATRLLNTCKKAFNFEDVEVFGWSDSTIVLAWLADSPKRWKSFIANRTSEIMQILPSKVWRHVSSKDNPADCASRGLTPKELCKFQMWWTGPRFLHENINYDSTNNTSFSTEVEQRNSCNITSAHVAIELKFDLLDRYSSLWKLVRVIAICCRWKNMKSERGKPFYSCKELQSALKIAIRLSQQFSFAEDIKQIQNGKPISTNSKISKLNPFVDKEGVLRVGGRIEASHLTYDQKHPVILAKECPLSNLIIDDIHKRYFHAGKRLMLRIIRQKYWIVSCNSLVNKYIHRCTTCIKVRGTVCQQMMGNLPPQRIQPSPPFFNTGVDYAGPFWVKSWKGRGAKVYKCYVALFVCLAVKAVHLELVTDMTTAAFLAALRRFISRRGYCKNIYSDNGSNFIGARNQLNELFKLFKTDEFCQKTQHEMSKLMINWNFIPPTAPHFGGIWESNVKQMKFYLNRTVGSHHLTFEEFSTLLCQIEACLNSRPLVAETNDTSSLEVLTPGHFLIGRPLISFPEQHYEDNLKYLNRWQFIQYLHQHFWRKWSLDYVTQLQQRQKWTKSFKNLKVDDLVIIKDANSAPGVWTMGRVHQVHPGKDGLVRVVTLKVKEGYVTRPVHRLCLLPRDQLKDAFQGAQNVGN